MISKELLSAVLGVEVDNLQFGSRTLSYHEIGSTTYDLNIHELASLVKEWAISQEYELKSSKPIVQDDEGRQVFNYFWVALLFKFDGGFDAPRQVLMPYFTAETEPEAVFKAGEWILKELKNGNSNTNN